MYCINNNIYIIKTFLFLAKLFLDFSNTFNVISMSNNLEAINFALLVDAELNCF